MATRTRVSLVLLAYLLLGGMLFAIPIFLLIQKNIPYRFELLAGFYASVRALEFWRTEISQVS